MSSKLIITSVEKLQGEIIRISKSLVGVAGIYVSLNRPADIVNEGLEQKGVDTSRFFFIDCVGLEKSNPDILKIKPDDLDRLKEAVRDFILEIPKEKFLLFDALSTLLIYNSEESVASFIKEIIEFAREKKVIVIAVSPHTKGENLLDKIYNFFDEVKKSEDEKKQTKTQNNQELIY